MLTQQLRRQFIEYFKTQSHRHVTSSAVVPHADPSLLFNNAGMNQFKEVFLGASIRDYTRAVTCQKCIRAGGKHNDLENVGHTTRHLTFFEMLGNFSFGDYFKADAIRFAWEVSTNIFGFDPIRIWPTIFRSDEEAFELWLNYVPAERITRFDEKDNFWSMGDTGPCGPCSELFYDRGPAYGNATCPAEDKEGTRFLEFWNLVFMQYNCQPDGTLQPLPKPCVDTGAGLERVVALKMDVPTVFETDVLRSLIAQVEDVSQVGYATAPQQLKPAFCVIADHLRTLAFAIADGAQPSNVERGYVLRKILRRAVRYGRMLGLEQPFLARILPRLIATMGEDYPELISAQQRIAELLTTEEEAFMRTLQRGGNMLQQVIHRAETYAKQISGDDAFKLKDTYGLPIDEIALIAKDNNLSVDIDRYEALEQEARNRSKQRQKSSQHVADNSIYAIFAETYSSTCFLGYHQTNANATVLALIQDEHLVDYIEAGTEAVVLLDRTPFYASMGGQIGDTGTLKNAHSLFEVHDCSSPYKGIIAHSGILKTGFLRKNDTLSAHIQESQRRLIASNHTATHLLHWALQQVLGSHVRQAGSIVDAERLRFDFNHHKALSQNEILTLENLVNEKIRANVAVSCYEIPYTDAQQRQDIKQFFGDKYGAHVRVVDIDFSKELCGGTHAERTGNIGSFAVVKEGSIAAGVRRIEAVTGSYVEALRRADINLIEQAAEVVKAKPSQLLERLEKLQEENKTLNALLKKHRQQQLDHLISDLINRTEIISSICLIAAEVNLDTEELRQCSEELIIRLGSGIVALANSVGDRCQVVIRVSEDLVSRGLRASDFAKEIGTIVEGSGGGKPTNAQAGGKLPSKLPAALTFIRQKLSL